MPNKKTTNTSKKYSIKKLFSNFITVIPKKLGVCTGWASSIFKRADPLDPRGVPEDRPKVTTLPSYSWFSWRKWVSFFYKPRYPFDDVIKKNSDILSNSDTCWDEHTVETDFSHPVSDRPKILSHPAWKQQKPPVEIILEGERPCGNLFTKKNDAPISMVALKPPVQRDDDSYIFEDLSTPESSSVDTTSFVKLELNDNKNLKKDICKSEEPCESSFDDWFFGD